MFYTHSVYPFDKLGDWPLSLGKMTITGLRCILHRALLLRYSDDFLGRRVSLAMTE